MKLGVLFWLYLLMKLGSVYLAVFIDGTFCTFWLYLLMKLGSVYLAVFIDETWEFVFGCIH